MGFLSALTGGDVGKQATKAQEQNTGLLASLQKTGNGLIDSGYDYARGYLGEAASGYNPYMASGGQANQTYSDALGLNGQGGVDAATSAFHESPGYQFSVDQGTQAALRGASAGGMINSGNTLTALNDYGQGMANKEYGSWLDRLSGLSGQGLTATNAKTGVLNNLATAATGQASDKLGLLGSVIQGQMGINSNIGNIKEQQSAQSGGFLGGLLKTGLGLGTKALTGGLF